MNNPFCAPRKVGKVKFFAFYAKVKIYSAKHYESDVLEEDYVPAKRDSDGVAGLYDLETDTFLTSDGTNDFVIGEPPAPEGGHACVIDGTARKITSGKAMVGGTVYEISSGKTMVDGTVYEITFTKEYTITVTGTGYQDIVYFTINNGEQIISPGTYVANLEDELGFVANGGIFRTNIIVLNGTTVSEKFSTKATYSCTVKSNIRVVLHYDTGGAEIDITTE